MDLMKDLSSFRLHTKLREAMFEQDSRSFNVKLKKISYLRDKFDTRFNSLISKIIVEEDLKETFRLVEMLFELKEEMLSLIVEGNCDNIMKDEEEIEE